MKSNAIFPLQFSMNASDPNATNEASDTIFVTSQESINITEEIENISEEISDRMIEQFKQQLQS